MQKIKESITAFEDMGHSVTLTDDGNVLPRHNGAPSDESKRLIAEMRACKAEVIEYLTTRNFIRDASESLLSSGYAKFWSKSLMDMVYIISNWDILTSLPDGVLAFTVQEIRTLALSTHTPAELHDLGHEKRLLLAAHRAYLEKQNQITAPSIATEKPTIEDIAAIFSGTVLARDKDVTTE